MRKKWSNAQVGGENMFMAIKCLILLTNCQTSCLLSLFFTCAIWDFHFIAVCMYIHIYVCTIGNILILSFRTSNAFIICHKSVCARQKFAFIYMKCEKRIRTKWNRKNIVPYFIRYVIAYTYMTLRWLFDFFQSIIYRVLYMKPIYICIPHLSRIQWLYCWYLVCIHNFLPMHISVANCNSSVLPHTAFL